MAAQLGDRLPGAGPHRVGQGEEPAGPSVPTDEDDGAPLGLQPVRLRLQLGRWVHEAPVADHHRGPVDVGPHPLAGDGLEGGGIGDRDGEPALPGARHHRPSDGVLGPDLGGRGPGQHLGLTRSRLRR